MTDLNALAKAVEEAKVNLDRAADVHRVAVIEYESAVDALKAATQSAIDGRGLPQISRGTEAAIEAISDDGQHDHVEGNRRAVPTKAEAKEIYRSIWLAGSLSGAPTNGADKSEEETI